MRQQIGRAVSAAVLALAVVGCTSSGQAAAPPPTRSASPLPTVAPSASVDAAGIARANAAVKQALAELAAAERTLNADFAWVRRATADSKVSKDPNKLVLWSTERKRVGSAHGAAKAAINLARKGGKSRPADCSAVRSGKAGVAAAEARGRTYLAQLDALATAATAQLAKARTDRARVVKALATLKAVKARNPLATVSTDVEFLLASAHGPSEQQALAAAIARTRAGGGSAVADISRLRAASRSIATYCGG